jgi:hypothetical protein
VYETKNSGWRNVTAGPALGPDSYGFWLNDGGAVVTLPSGFGGTWKRNNFNNTLTIGVNAVKSSSSDYLWVLQRVSGDAYTFKRADAANTLTITIRLESRYSISFIIISGDSGSGENNWNGEWRKQ